MGFFLVQCPVVVIGALCIDGDPHICAVLHQVLSCLAVHLDAVYVAAPGVKGRESLDPLVEFLGIPSRLGTGLGQDLGIVRIDAEDIFGNLVLGDGLNNILDTGFLILVGQVDGQLLTCDQVDLFDLPCERVAAVHQDGAADAVKGLAVSEACCIS